MDIGMDPNSLFLGTDDFGDALNHNWSIVWREVVICPWTDTPKFATITIKLFFVATLYISYHKIAIVFRQKFAGAKISFIVMNFPSFLGVLSRRNRSTARFVASSSQS